MRTAISTIAFATAGDPPSLGTALAEAQDATHVVADAAEADAAATVAAVIEHAAEQIDDAQAAAAAIAAAAMETELGRQIAATNARVEECQGNLSGLQSSVETLTATVSELQAQLAATAAVTLVTALDQNSSIPPPSAETPETKVEEAIGQVTSILPEAVAPVENTPVAQAPVKKPGKRFL